MICNQFLRSKRKLLTISSVSFHKPFVAFFLFKSYTLFIIVVPISKKRYFFCQDREINIFVSVLLIIHRLFQISPFLLMWLYLSYRIIHGVQSEYTILNLFFFLTYTNKNFARNLKPLSITKFFGVLFHIYYTRFFIRTSNWRKPSDVLSFFRFKPKNVLNIFFYSSKCKDSLAWMISSTNWNHCFLLTSKTM